MTYKKLWALEVLKYTEISQLKSQRKSTNGGEIYIFFTFSLNNIKYSLYFINTLLYFMTRYIIKANHSAVK